MGLGGQVWAEAHLGWCRDTIRKGTHELRSGMTCVDALSARRRKPAEEHLPRLLDDIRDLVDGPCQADPKFQTRRLFIRISAAQVRLRLIARKGYTDAELPSQQTINTKLNMLGYRLTEVAKCRPPKGSRRPTLSSILPLLSAGPRVSWAFGQAAFRGYHPGLIPRRSPGTAS